MKIPVPIRIALRPALLVVELVMLMTTCASLVSSLFILHHLRLRRACVFICDLGLSVVRAAQMWLPDPCWYRGGPWLEQTAEEEADERMPRP